MPYGASNLSSEGERGPRSTHGVVGTPGGNLVVIAVVVVGHLSDDSEWMQQSKEDLDDDKGRRLAITDPAPCQHGQTTR